MAMGRFDELIDRRLSTLESEGISESLASSMLFLYGIKGDTTAAGQFIRDYLGQPEEYEDETGRKRTAAILSYYEEGARKLDAYARLCEMVGEPGWLYRAAVAKRDWNRATSLIDDELPQAPLQHLLLYVMASYEKNSAMAKEQLEQAVHLLKQQSKGERQLAKWLADGGNEPDLEQVYEISLSPAQYPVVLTALGFRFPERRRVFRVAARKANYDPSFPGLVLDEVLF